METKANDRDLIGSYRTADIVKRQDEIPSEFRGNIYAYIMFGMEG